LSEMLLVITLLVRIACRITSRSDDSSRIGGALFKRGKIPIKKFLDNLLI
jgi:hypothetical protein